MNRFFKILAAVLVVLACVAGGTFAGCTAGVMGGSALDGLKSHGATVAQVGIGLGALAGLIGGLFLAHKVLQPPPPRDR